MPVKTFRPLTPSTRYISFADFSDITKTKPEKSLVEIRKKTGGRNMYGRATARGIGGGHKQKIRLVDFKRNKHGVEATVLAIEYDPMRSARLALLEYQDGEKRYIIAPVGIKVGAKIMSGPTAPPEIGNSLPLKSIPVGLAIHNLELTPGRGGQMVRSAGGAATLMSRDEGHAQVRPLARKLAEETLGGFAMGTAFPHEDLDLQRRHCVRCCYWDGLAGEQARRQDDCGGQADERKPRRTETVSHEIRRYRLIR